MSLPWIPTATLINMCCGLSATRREREKKVVIHCYIVLCYVLICLCNINTHHSMITLHILHILKESSWKKSMMLHSISNMTITSISKECIQFIGYRGYDLKVVQIFGSILFKLMAYSLYMFFSFNNFFTKLVCKYLNVFWNLNKENFLLPFPLIFSRYDRSSVCKNKLVSIRHLFTFSMCACAAQKIWY